MTARGDIATRDVTAERLARARATIAAAAGGLRGGVSTRRRVPRDGRRAFEADGECPDGGEVEATARHEDRARGARGSQHGLPPIERILGGEWLETAHGRAFVRDTWFAPEHRHGNLPLSAGLSLSDDALACLLGTVSAVDATETRPRVSPDPLHRLSSTVYRRCDNDDGSAWQTSGLRPPSSSTLSRAGFFDIETTGLGGGTGTYAFLAGLGTFEPEGFRLRQYFLADVGGERAMLALLAEDLARCDALVTYNGRAFDVPIVETRLTLARLATPCAELAHFDLLHAVRRLYRHRMPSCRLADAERRLLGIERFDDTPGSLMPAMYFAYVRAGQVAPLRGVFRHNAEDVMSLVGVIARLAWLFDDPAPAPDDAAALARWWELAGAPERALPLYRAALPWLEGGDDWAWAAHRHARLSRRSGAYDEAATLWRALWTRGDDAAGLALAKHLEHRARDYAAAEEITTGLLASSCEAGERAALRQRLARVRRKQGRIRSG